MSNPISDRNLLLGVLALQFGLVTRDQLVDAISAWGGDKSQPLNIAMSSMVFTKQA
ncbi:hypothetical protein ETAA8_39850 [Anatilimnocola aggregata]|uniref:Uncharacterized protein n=1 Tax=Anatilimnocola aggregata TaxID=2528021 RepID=A0A517YF83_9BACT|nr:hypothetical protein [Anatilimnocola aggregata]QDU28879.1 hypothetical protein ETAA8_39850 [Anatilimnocola aggregata]